MGDAEIVELIINKVQDQVNALHSYGEQFYDTHIIEKVLRSLTQKFDPLTIAIEESMDLTQLTLPNLLASLHIYEHKIQDRAKNLDQEFQGKFLMNDKSSSSSNSKSNSRGHGRGCSGSSCGRCDHGRGRGLQLVEAKAQTLNIMNSMKNMITQRSKAT